MWTVRLLLILLLFLAANVPASSRRSSSFHSNNHHDTFSSLGRVALVRRKSALSHNHHKTPLDLSEWQSVSSRGNQGVKQQPNSNRSEKQAVQLVARRRLPRGRLRGSHKKEQATESTESVDPEVLQALAEPIFSESVWVRLSGRELEQHPEVVDALADTAERVASTSPHSQSDAWIEWKDHGQHDKLDLEAGDVLVWTGVSKQEGFGSTMPWVKTQAVLPLAAEELKDLLLDSDRVKTYNKWTLGRTDCWVRQDETNSVTKIIKSRVKPPMGKKTLVSVSLMHARPIRNDSSGENAGWLVVTRATGGHRYDDPFEDGKNVCRNDILMGVNLLQTIPGRPKECLHTCVNHVHSDAIPKMLAERLGVKGVLNFVKDLRSLAVPASV